MTQKAKTPIIDTITFINPKLGTKYSVNRIGNGPIFFRDRFFHNVLDWVDYIHDIENVPPSPPQKIPTKIVLRRSKSINRDLADILDEIHPSNDYI